MDVVDLSFISQLQGSLDRFRETGDNFNFRCPFCGDSKKSETKARGWLRWNTDDRSFHYSCYNCNESHGLLGLIKKVRPSLADAYVAERFKSAGKGRDLQENRSVRRALAAKPVFAPREEAEQPVVAPAPAVATVIPETPETKAPPFPRFPEVERVVDCDWGLEYMASRQIPFEELAHVFAVDSIRDVSSRIEAYKEKRFRKLRAVLFPFYGPAGEMAYLQARTWDVDLRYLTFEVGGGGKLWGRHRIVNSGRIFLFEGAFDAMCVRNAAASGGVDLIRAAKILRDEYPDAEICLCFDKDWRINEQVYDQVVKAVDQGYTVVFTKGPQKDVNDLIVKSGWSRDDVHTMLNECAISGLRAKLEISKTRKPIREKKIWKSSTRTT